jgi:hypothetical protein
VAFNVEERQERQERSPLTVALLWPPDIQ